MEEIEVAELLEDTREIKAIFFEDGTLGWTTEPCPGEQVPARNADKIEVYAERGWYGPVPWFAIWRQGKIIERVNANAVSEVWYESDKPGDGRCAGEMPG